MKKKNKEFVFCKNCSTLIEKGKKCSVCGCDEYDEYLSLDVKDIDYPRYPTSDIADINTWDTISNTNWNSISTTLNSISNAMKKLKDYSV